MFARQRWHILLLQLGLTRAVRRLARGVAQATTKDPPEGGPWPLAV